MTISNARSSSRSKGEIGIGLMALTMLMVPGIDAMAKVLSTSLAPGLVAWGRFVFQTAVLLPLMLIMRRRIRSSQKCVHAARGILLACAVLLIFWAVKYLPLANTLAIFFVEPLILTLFSVVFLGESIGLQRLAAVMAGLVGALVVIRPNWEVFGWASILPLGAAICYAGYLTLTRHSSTRDEPLVMQLWAGIFGVIILSAALVSGQGAGISVIDPSWPGIQEWGLLMALGLLSAVGHVMLAFAFSFAAAGILAPFQYLEIISATILGFLLFGDFPDAVTWLGTALIIGSGLYVYTLERNKASSAALIEDIKA